MKAPTYKAVFSFDVAKQCQPDGSCIVERICITESLDIPLSRVFERISNFQRGYLVSSVINAIQKGATDIDMRDYYDCVITPKDLAYVSGQAFDDYIHDMEICQQYAIDNRMLIAERLLGNRDWWLSHYFCTIHNYIDTKHMILRKGAVSARQCERLIIEAKDDK